MIDILSYLALFGIIAGVLFAAFFTMELLNKIGVVRRLLDNIFNKIGL